MEILQKIKTAYNKSSGIKRTFLFNVYSIIFGASYFIVQLFLKITLNYLGVNFYELGVVSMIIVSLITGYTTALFTLNTFVKDLEEDDK